MATDGAGAGAVARLGVVRRVHEAVGHDFVAQVHGHGNGFVPGLHKGLEVKASTRRGVQQLLPHRHPQLRVVRKGPALATQCRGTLDACT